MKVSEIRFVNSHEARSQSEDRESQPILNLDAGASLEEKVIAALRTIHDPELPVNIYDLGLIYLIHIDEQAKLQVQMTLTAPACPVAGTLPGQVEAVLRQVDGIRDASVELVWDPPWTRERMSEEAKLTLGLF